MYTFVLLLHSWVRWAAIALGIAATVAAFNSRPADQTGAERWGLFLMMVLDIQMLLGLLLYLALSPLTAMAMQNFGGAMRDPSLRFWAVEHVVMMLFAVVIVHVGRVLARTARTPESRRIRLLVCLGLATAAMLIATPWPGTANGRPLFRI
jgi:hypothetical protein